MPAPTVRSRRCISARVRRVSMPAPWRSRSGEHCGGAGRLLWATLACVLAAGPAAAQPWQPRDDAADQALPPAEGVEGGDRQAIARTIADQLAAFRAGDSARAFSYASARLQAQFGDAATFMAMVRRDYAPVFAARSVTARDLVLYHGYVTQRSVLVGADGLPFVAL